MAEIVGTVASVAQLVSLSGELLAGGYGFICRVVRAPSEIRSLLIETAAINGLLGQLQILAESEASPGLEDALHALEKLGIFQECQTTLKSIQNALATCEQMHGKNVKNFGRRLIWPFKERETKDALQRLHNLRGLLANAVEANNASTLRRIETNQGLLFDQVTFLTDSVKTQMTQEETRAVMAWVYPLSSDGAYTSLENALSLRVPGTGNWFLESKIFTEWSKYGQGNEGVWITGLPGSGKTLLCASIIERLQQMRDDSTTAVLYFFCDHRDRTKKSLEDFQVTITKQILDQSPACLIKAKELYEEKGKNFGKAFNKSDYLSLIESFLPSFKEVFIVVDALDEALDGDRIAESLAHFTTSHPFIKTLFSSRFDILIEQRHGSIAKKRVTLAANTRNDIEHLISTELRSRMDKGAIKVRDRSLVSIIQSRIEDQAGTLLQARLQLDYLTTARTDRDVRSIVQNLPNGLEHTYDTLLQSMSSRYPSRVDEMRFLLRCLVAAVSPLSATQLSEIMALRPGERCLDFDTVTTDPYDTLEVIAPFVVVDREEKTHGIIKLSHFSLDEYLRSNAIRHGPAKSFYVDDLDANAELARICLQYLTFSIFDPPLDAGPTEPIPNEKGTYTFYRYAALNWYNHMYRAKMLPGFTDRYEPYLSWFVNGGHGPSCYQKWQQAFSEAYPYSEASFHSPICFAIWAGLDEMVDSLLPSIGEVDRYFADGFTCLTVAAMTNEVQVAQKLLALGANVNRATSDRDLTPLHLAAEFGCQETFDLLLEAGADPHARSASGTTPFYRSFRGGNLYIIKCLKECGSDVNAATWDDWTPLMEAIENGREQAVDLLLEWGADVEDVMTNEGMTPYSLAEALPYRSIARKIRIATFGSAAESDAEMETPPIEQEQDSSQPGGIITETPTIRPEQQNTKCSQCDQAFRDDHELRLHVAQEHPVVMRHAPPTEEAMERYLDSNGLRDWWNKRSKSSSGSQRQLASTKETEVGAQGPPPT
ncbi:hypothetical protein BDV96DRAFT_597044 [Lophiotrema nucula]|uniref:C2H2-type domain-containing protein n=1 Tax=Lophiotrema nucula TaxID=690887 RepID=A0A6A5ZIN1_9PLEO|nr:hypothetical protein BDV96DRAFT_597044 [Lophiotrema nucula]